MIKPPYVVELFIPEKPEDQVHWRIVNYLRGGEKVQYQAGDALSAEGALKQIRTAAEGL